jgi:hypothetical protein
MKTAIERSIELEDSFRAEVVAKCPSLDPDWAVNRDMALIHEDSRKNAKIFMLMMEIIVAVKAEER